MSYYYEYTFSDLAEFLSSPEGMAVAGVVLFFLAFLAVQYVFQSLSLYAIARRRGIAHPGLAWVPVAYSWILGSISDQYQYVVRVRSAITGKYFWLWPLCPSFSAEQGFC